MFSENCSIGNAVFNKYTFPQEIAKPKHGRTSAADLCTQYDGRCLPGVAQHMRRDFRLTDLYVAEPTLREQIRPAILILYLTESNSKEIDRHPETGKN